MLLAIALAFSLVALSFTFHYLSVATLELGFFKGAPIGEAMNYLYYSGVIFTTLGLGDIQPVGHIRFITAIEALNGFFLITWSASFTFLAMGRLWPWGNHCATNTEEENR